MIAQILKDLVAPMKTNIDAISADVPYRLCGAGNHSASATIKGLRNKVRVNKNCELHT